jgi:DNA mismatch endonuclease Vsr
MDRHSKEQRRRIMQAVKSQGSKLEITFAKALWAKGLRYRKNNRTVFGTPDFTFKKYKVAIFIDSEFWHGKNWKNKKNEIKSNQEFWTNKIERNIKRDKEVSKFLLKDGWKVLRFWGNEVIKNLDNCINKVEETLNEAKRNNYH